MLARGFQTGSSTQKKQTNLSLLIPVSELTTHAAAKSVDLALVCDCSCVGCAARYPHNGLSCQLPLHTRRHRSRLCISEAELPIAAHAPADKLGHDEGVSPEAGRMG